MNNNLIINNKAYAHTHTHCAQIYSFIAYSQIDRASAPILSAEHTWPRCCCCRCSSSIDNAHVYTFFLNIFTFSLFDSVSFNVCIVFCPVNFMYEFMKLWWWAYNHLLLFFFSCEANEFRERKNDFVKKQNVQHPCGFIRKKSVHLSCIEKSNFEKTFKQNLVSCVIAVSFGDQWKTLAVRMQRFTVALTAARY